MKKKVYISLYFLLVLSLLNGCQSTSQTALSQTHVSSNETPIPVGESTIAVTMATVTSTQTPMSQDMSILPFAQQRIVPGHSTKREVIEILGEPNEMYLSGGWGYEIQGQVEFLTISFNGNVVTDLWIPIPEYELDTLVAELGIPEVVELRVSQVEPPVYPVKIFHYPSKGVSYFSSCTVSDEFRNEACETNHKTEKIIKVHQYSPLSLTEFTDQALIGTRFIKWNGFNDEE